MDKIEYIRNHFALGNIIVAEALNRYLDEIVNNADAYIKQEEEDEKNGKLSWISKKGLVRDAKAIQNYLDKE